MLSLFSIALDNYLENKATYKELCHIEEKVSKEINKRKNKSLLQHTLLCKDDTKVFQDKILEVDVVNFGDREDMYIVKFIGDNIIKCRIITFEYDDNLDTSVFLNSDSVGYGRLTSDGYMIILRKDMIRQLFKIIGIEDCAVSYDALSTFLLDFIYNDSIDGVVYCVGDEFYNYNL